MTDTTITGPGGDVVDTAKLSRYSDQDMPSLLRISNALRWFVDKVGKIGAWFAVPLVIITVIDVVARKLTWRSDANEVVGLQPFLINTFGPMFGSTLLQELQWHAHTALFALVLGYGYIYNTHVRVDLVRETLGFRRKAWLEFLGVTFFLIPYCAIVIYFAYTYAYESYQIGEISASTVGLSHRWIIKSVLVIGLIVALLAGVAVWLQTIIALWGDPNKRFDLMTIDWPEEAGLYIEGKKRLDLDEVEDPLEVARRRALADAEEAAKAAAEKK